MPAVADRGVWEKVTKGRAGKRWDSVVEEVWKDIGGNQEEILSIHGVGGYKTGETSAKKQGERGTLKRLTGG